MDVETHPPITENPPTHSKRKPLTPAQRALTVCRATLSLAVKRGQVAKSAACSVPNCKPDDPIEAHHPDPARPYFVAWVCRGHRFMIQRELIAAPPATVLRPEKDLRVPKKAKRAAWRKAKKDA